MGTIMRTFAATAVAAGLAMSLVAPASADTTVDMGETDVVVDPAVYDFLVGAGVAIAPTGAATAEPFGDTVLATFPITDISKKGNKIAHKGGVELSAGAIDIKLSSYTIRIDKTRVTGRASGSEIGNAGRVPLFKIQATDDPELGAVKLVLTKAAAGALNATFGTELAKGDDFGYATPMPEDGVA